MKIGKTAATFKKMNKICSPTAISTRLKIRLYHSIILPCLFYVTNDEILRKTQSYTLIKMITTRITWRRTFKNDLEWADTTWDEVTTLAKNSDAWKLFAAQYSMMHWRT